MRPLRCGTLAPRHECPRPRQMPPAPGARRQASRSSSQDLSVVSPIAPDISGVDALRRLVLAPIGIARRLRLKSWFTPVGTELSVVVLSRLPPRIARRRNVPAVIIVVVIPSTLLVVTVTVWTRRHAVKLARPVGIPPRDELMLGIDDLATAVDAEAFGDWSSAADLHLARIEVDGFACQMAFGLGRRRSQRGFRRHVGPCRLDHRLEDRDCDVAAGGAAAERAPLAVGIVVADPDGDGDVVGEADEPGIVFIVGGAG